MSEKYLNAVYRVSIKAIIRNSNNEILVVKENSETWDLPGGGIDHGENYHEALQRELFEELNITSVFNKKFIKVETIYNIKRDAWIMYLMFEITMDNLEYSNGIDVTESTFISPEVFKDSSNPYEKIIYKLSDKK